MRRCGFFRDSAYTISQGRVEVTRQEAHLQLTCRSMHMATIQANDDWTFESERYFGNKVPR